MAPRLIRRRPLGERIKSALDPVENLHWLSEKIESSEWHNFQAQWSIPLGLLLNFCFLVARANTASAADYSGDKVFGDDDGNTRWSAWFSTFIVHVMVSIAFLNAFYTFWRRRHYRLFEKPVNAVLSTPSAKRVRVNSSPVSSSPLRYLSSVLAGETAESRAHPDTTRDVWELAIWDPTPFSLTIFCALSPGHALIYLSFLPTATADPRPGTTVTMTVLLGAMLSMQLYLLRSNFSQQSKDASLVHKEVMNEYETKFVHPRTQHKMRDVGTQFSSRKSRRSGSPTYEVIDEDVDTCAPTYVINKGYHTHPNPAYTGHLDPDDSMRRQTNSRGVGSSASFQTPLNRQQFFSPPQSQSLHSPRPGDGGSLGVFRHASSPLRKSMSSNSTILSQYERAGSPQKRRNTSAKRSSFAVPSDGYKMR